MRRCLIFLIWAEVRATGAGLGSRAGAACAGSIGNDPASVSGCASGREDGGSLAGRGAVDGGFGGAGAASEGAAVAVGASGLAGASGVGCCAGPGDGGEHARWQVETTRSGSRGSFIVLVRIQSSAQRWAYKIGICGSATRVTDPVAVLWSQPRATWSSIRTASGATVKLS